MERWQESRRLVIFLLFAATISPLAVRGEENHAGRGKKGDHYIADPGSSGSPFGSNVCTVARAGATPPAPTACYPATCCPEDIGPAVCLPAPPDCTGRICGRRQPARLVDPSCEAACVATNPQKPPPPVECTASAVVDDLIFTEHASGPTGCEALHLLCEVVKQKAGAYPEKLTDKTCAPIF